MRLDKTSWASASSPYFVRDHYGAVSTLCKMDRNSFTTPTTNASRLASSLSRSRTTAKRDSLAAELERGEATIHSPSHESHLNQPGVANDVTCTCTDPQLSSAKRQQRSQTLTSHLAHASLERQLVAAQTAKADLETNLREKNAQIARLEEDRRWLAEREQEERLEKERERTEHAEDKVSLATRPLAFSSDLK